MQYPGYAQFLKNIENTSTPQTENLKKLEYGEMLAINQYTGAKYQDINKLLRDPNSLPIEKIPEMIMHIAVASNGLNKVPDVNLPIVIRNQGKELLNEYIKNVKENNVTAEKAFISTSYESQKNFTSANESEGIKIIFKNVKGKDISPLSNYPNEKEYLLPPSTQLKWSGYSKTKLGHVFVTDGANVLIEEKISKYPIYNKQITPSPAYEPPPDYDNITNKKHKTSYKSTPYEPLPDYDDKPLQSKKSNSAPPPEPEIDYLKTAKKVGQKLQNIQSKAISNPTTPSPKLTKSNNYWAK